MFAMQPMRHRIHVNISISKADITTALVFYFKYGSVAE